jgi:hypothetical protein
LTAVDIPDTETGVDDETEEAFPSCFEALLPQHFASPVDNTAHVLEPPADIETAPLRDATETAVEESVVVLFPNCPDALFPQH